MNYLREHKLGLEVVKGTGDDVVWGVQGASPDTYHIDPMLAVEAYIEKQNLNIEINMIIQKLNM